MKRILTVTLALLCLLPLSAQKNLSLFRIANEWDGNKEYSFNDIKREHMFDKMVLSFAREYDENPMLRALEAQFSGDADKIDIPVAEFKLDEKNNYLKLRLESEEIAETEVRYWPLSGNQGWFVIKMINHDEDTLPRIYFLSVDTAKGVMKPAQEPDGMNYGFADHFVIPSTGNSIEVSSEGYPSDHIVLKDGVFVYESSMPVCLSCYVNDPDPSGLTNIRDTPSGKVIGRIGDPKNHPKRVASSVEEQMMWDGAPDDDATIVTIFNPKNGWWQILEDTVDGIKIKDQAWIHYSVLEMRTRNYGRQPLKLYAKPSASSSVMATITEEESRVRPMDLSEDGEWTKVKCSAGTGWIETSWLCGNPYTTCP